MVSTAAMQVSFLICLRFCLVYSNCNAQEVVIMSNALLCTNAVCGTLVIDLHNRVTDETVPSCAVGAIALWSVWDIA